MLSAQSSISLGKNKPTLSKTKFGWLISGPIQIQRTLNTVHCNHSTLKFDDYLDEQLSQFFELEKVITQKPISKEEQECEQSFIENTNK